MPFKVIERLLQQTIGLHSATVGSSTVAQAVEQRMLECNISSAHDYLRVVRHSATELDALIDAVVIPETWFYRDESPFNAFSKWVSHHWLPHNGHSPLRVLSVPCSTGEEPYTLAMCLADLGLPSEAARIDAIDISRSHIAKAGVASYGDNSFRSKDLGFRDRYFIGDGRQFQLKEDIRARVNFFRANIFGDSFLHEQQPYHVIFCRNLLIYFDRPTQHRAIDQLERLLTGDGVLFLGHSETSPLLERGFTALNYPRCFGFKREHDKHRQPRDSTAPKTLNRVTRTRPAADNPANTARPFAEVRHEVPQTPATTPGMGKVNGPSGDREGPLEGKVNGPSGDREGPLEGKVNGPRGDREGPLEGKVNGPAGDREGPLEGKVNGPAGDREGPLEGKVNGPRGDREPPLGDKVNGPAGTREAPLDEADRLLDEAFQLADQGHLAEAVHCCENLLRQHRHQADAYFLLGLIREAAGSLEAAAQMLRKAIYLDPNHYEALTYLSQVCRHQGDADSAQRFRQRATRAQQRRQDKEKRR